MSHVFISYARADQVFVWPFVERLARVYRIWIDKEGLTGSALFNTTIDEKIKTADAMLLFLSPNSVDSGYVLNEIQSAIQYKIPIVPYLYHPCELPIPLRTTQYIPHTNPDAFGLVLDALIEKGPNARIHPGKAFNLQNLDLERTRFGQASQGKTGILSNMPLQTAGQKLIGLPVHFSRYHAVYLVGRENDTLIYQPTMQVIFQMTGALGANNMVVEIGNHFTKSDANFPLRMLLVRGPLAKADGSYGYSAQHPEEWEDNIWATQKILETLYPMKPKLLQIFIQGPAIFLYKLGAEHKGVQYRAELYHYDREDSAYYKVL